MQWLECTVPCNGNIDEMCARLNTLGVDGMIVEDETDFKDFLEKNRACWDYVDTALESKFSGVSRIRFWLSRNDDGLAVLHKIKASGWDPEISLVADEDWENNWKQYYKPIPVGERLLVVPEWEDAEAGSRIRLRLDPGLIFGTGSHATTRMCLEALEKADVVGKRVLDLGCGSGILAIGALLLGCREAVGCDIDPKAPDVAEANASLNRLGRDRFRVYAGDVLSDGGMRRRLGSGYDIVLANIVADVILALTAYAVDFLTPVGCFICSGIIEGRQEEVRQALESAGFSIEKHRCKEEWHCFVCKRKEPQIKDRI